MKTTPLRLVSFGSARALTRDMLGGNEIEFAVKDSREPTA